MQLVSGRTENQYAKSFRENEIKSAITRRKEPEISGKTRCFLDPDVVHARNVFDVERYQNAAVYVHYSCDDKDYLLVTVNKSRGIKDKSADKVIMTPGGRRDVDHGILYTALKELEEETQLSIDTLYQQFPNTTVRYIKSDNIKSKRGGFSFNSQIHLYLIELGIIDKHAKEILDDLIKGGDDVALAQFIDVTRLNEKDFSGTLSIQLSPEYGVLPLLPAVAMTMQSILRNNFPASHSPAYSIHTIASFLCEHNKLLREDDDSSSVAANSSSASTSSSKSSSTSSPSQKLSSSKRVRRRRRDKSEKETLTLSDRNTSLVTLLLQALENENSSELGRLVRTAMLILPASEVEFTLTKIDDKKCTTSEKNTQKAYRHLLENYRVTHDLVEKIQQEYSPKSDISKQLKRQLSDNSLTDVERFKLIQDFIGSSPNKEYARRIKNIVLDNVQPHLKIPSASTKGSKP